MSEFSAFLVKRKTEIFIGLCAFVHAGFFMVFEFLKIAPASLINIFSLFFYVFIVSFQHKNMKRTVVLCFFEITFYSVLMSLLFGYETGFLLYIIGMAVVIMYLLPTDRKTSTILQIISLCILLLIIPLQHMIGIIYPEERQMLLPYVDNIFWVNLACAVFCILYINFLYVKEMEQSNKTLNYRSNHDPLTGLYNRAYIKSYVESVSNDDYPEMVLLMCDVDDFKKINDTYGHDVGDDALKTLASILRSNVRNADIVSRWGGEEFLIILTNCPYEKGIEVAEKIRVVTTQTPYSKKTGDNCMTITIGVSKTHENEPFETSVERADQKLYNGKRNGKNQVQS